MIKYFLNTVLVLASFAPFPLAAGASEAPLQVVVSILPQVWFAESVGGDLVEVSVLVGPGHSPATFEPTPKQLARLQKADLFISAGVPFESALIPRIRSLRDGPPLVGPEPHPHSHGHGHHEIDPHIWLDPLQAKEWVRLYSEEFSRLRPESRRAFESRRDAILANLQNLHLEIQAQMLPFKGRDFFVFHPAFGHFAKAYGLVQIAVEEHGHEPGPRQLTEVVEHALASGAKAMVVQPQFSQKAARTVAKSAGMEIVTLDPLSPHYDTNLLQIAETLALHFQTGKGEGH